MPIRPRLTALVLLALLAGWGTAPVLARVTVVDDTGQRVTLPQPARRVVSLAPHLTELLYGVGAGATLVGAIEYSDYPEAARAVPRIGGARGLDLEAITALRPDLVLAWRSGNSPGQVERLERLGIPVFRNEPQRLDDIATTLVRLGALTGQETAGQAAASRLRARFAVLRARHAGLARVDVFFQVWPQPLMTIGGPHLITDVMQLCGARNVFAALGSPSPIVSIEAVVAARPQLIVSTTDGPGAAALEMWRRWPQIPAVRDQRLLLLDAALITRHTERIADGAAALCAAVAAVRAAVPAPATRP